MANLNVFLIGFACIEGILGTLLLINMALCLRKCRRKCCPQKRKGETKQLAKSEGTAVEMEDVSNKGGARYKDYL